MCLSSLRSSAARQGEVDAHSVFIKLNPAYHYSITGMFQKKALWEVHKSRIAIGKLLFVVNPGGKTR